MCCVVWLFTSNVYNLLDCISHVVHVFIVDIPKIGDHDAVIL